MTARQYLGAALAAGAAALTLWACGTYNGMTPGHVATIGCLADGEVYASAAQYGDGVYTLNGGAPVPFTGGFALELDGAQAWHLVVTADDWPTFDETAGPCRQPSTSTSTSSSTTTCPDCTINTVVITGPSTSTTSTTSTPPPDDDTPGASTTTTTAAPTPGTFAAPTTPTTSAVPVPTTTSPTSTTTSMPPAPVDALPVTR